MQVATMGLSNLSVQYLNYPTQVIFKSAKPVPTVFFGLLYHHKRYSPSDFIAVVMMTIGMVAFCMADYAAYDEFSLYGIVLVIAAILADATSGAVQEKILQQHKAPPDEVVLYTHLTGMVYLTIICIFGRELGEGAATAMARCLMTIVTKLCASAMLGRCLLLVAAAAYALQSCTLRVLYMRHVATLDASS
jgi:drug/metabolite transporter (DMT)-like permease